MLTPIEIQSRTFKSGLGYDKKEVDMFLHEILESYESMYRDNMELKDKLNTLNEGIQYYKTIEKTLQKALVLAQKTAEDTKASAQQKAKLIEKEAENKAQEILADAKNELHNLHVKTMQLIQQYDMYKAQFRNLAAAQIDILESESFQVHVANLDAFLVPEEAEEDSVKEEEETVSEASKEQAEESEYSEEDLEHFDYIDLED
ncbi:MAG: DivIVA domain-containing protein [Lachnospiraceae bacterium]|nr:DivIVA domain-containing protein [Lachnospiraceae bacterium]